MGLLYRNTRTRCGSLALLCAQVSHDTLRRVLYQQVPWSRRLWDFGAQGRVQRGGSLVIEDTSGERFTRVAEAVSWGWASSVGQPVWGMPVVLVVWTNGKVEGAARDAARAQRRAIESGTRAGLAPPSAAPGAAARVCPM